MVGANSLLDWKLLRVCKHKKATEIPIRFTHYKFSLNFLPCAALQRMTEECKK